MIPFELIGHNHKVERVNLSFKKIILNTLNYTTLKNGSYQTNSGPKALKNVSPFRMELVLITSISYDFITTNGHLNTHLNKDYDMTGVKIIDHVMPMKNSTSIWHYTRTAQHSSIVEVRKPIIATTLYVNRSWNTKTTIAKCKLTERGWYLVVGSGFWAASGSREEKDERKETPIAAATSTELERERGREGDAKGKGKWEGMKLCGMCQVSALSW